MGYAGTFTGPGIEMRFSMINVGRESLSSASKTPFPRLFAEVCSRRLTTSGSGHRFLSVGQSCAEKRASGFLLVIYNKSKNVNEIISDFVSKGALMKRKQLTTSAGIPVGDNQNSLTAGPRGPLLVQDWQLFEKHAHFNR